MQLGDDIIACPCSKCKPLIDKIDKLPVSEHTAVHLTALLRKHSLRIAVFMASHRLLPAMIIFYKPLSARLRCEFSQTSEREWLQDVRCSGISSAFEDRCFELTWFVLTTKLTSS